MELGTFLVNVYKGAVDKVKAYNNAADSKSLLVANNQVYYLEKTLIKTYFESDISACDAYISRMDRRLDLIQPSTNRQLVVSNQVYFLEKTIVKTYLQSDITATDNYISKMDRRLDLIRITLQSEATTFNVDCRYLIRFVGLCNNHVGTERKVLPKNVLKILNIIYKRKGDIIDIYKK